MVFLIRHGNYAFFRGLLGTLVFICLRASLDLSRRNVKIDRPCRPGLATPKAKDCFMGIVLDLSSDGRGVLEAPDG